MEHPERAPHDRDAELAAYLVLLDRTALQRGRNHGHADQDLGHVGEGQQEVLEEEWGSSRAAIGEQRPRAGDHGCALLPADGVARIVGPTPAALGSMAGACGGVVTWVSEGEGLGDAAAAAGSPRRRR